MKTDNLQNSPDHDQLLAYIYGEMDHAERFEFEKQLSQNPELQNTYREWNALQGVFKNLSPEKVPSHLSKNLFNQLGLKKAWYHDLVSALLRPALAGTAVLAIALGIAQQFRHPGVSPQPYANSVAINTRPPNAESSDLNFGDLFLSRRESPIKPPPRLAYSQPAMSNFVSLASYGNSGAKNQFSNFSYPHAATTFNNDQQIEQSAVDFMYKQAQELRAMGDYQGAAKQLAWLMKTYPDYPQKYKIFAERINCLFQAHDYETAKKELTWLQSLAPDLAYAVQSHWIQ